MPGDWSKFGALLQGDQDGLRASREWDQMAAQNELRRQARLYRRQQRARRGPGPVERLVGRLRQALKG